MVKGNLWGEKMKYVKQFSIILAVIFAGEILKHYLPFPVPAGIYGMILMFILLFSGVIKVADVKETSSFLLETMPIMFIPAGAGIIILGNVLKPIILPAIIIMFPVTIVVMAVSGFVTQAVIGKERNKNDK